LRGLFASTTTPGSEWSRRPTPPESRGLVDIELVRVGLQLAHREEIDGGGFARELDDAASGLMRVQGGSVGVRP
jgi:hypothetical protein